MNGDCALQAPATQASRLAAAALLAAASVILTATALSAPLPAVTAVWGRRGARRMVRGVAGSMQRDKPARRTRPRAVEAGLLDPAVVRGHQRHHQHDSPVGARRDNTAIEHRPRRVAHRGRGDSVGGRLLRRPAQARRRESTAVHGAHRRPPPWKCPRAAHPVAAVRRRQCGQAGHSRADGHLRDVGNPATSVASAAWYQQALADASLACPVAVAIAGLRAFRERAPGALITLAVLFAAECAMAAVSGSKGDVILAVAAIAISRASSGRNMAVGLIIATLAFFLLIVIPFTAAYRTEVHGGSTPGQAAVSLSPRQAAATAPDIAGTALGNASSGTIFRSVSYLGQRLQEIDPPRSSCRRPRPRSPT
jgi:hypothetical protein